MFVAALSYGFCRSDFFFSVHGGLFDACPLPWLPRPSVRPEHSVLESVAASVSFLGVERFVRGGGP